jgi:hypothetical protein
MTPVSTGLCATISLRRPSCEAWRAPPVAGTPLRRATGLEPATSGVTGRRHDSGSLRATVSAAEATARAAEDCQDAELVCVAATPDCAAASWSRCAGATSTSDVASSSFAAPSAARSRPARRSRAVRARCPSSTRRPERSPASRSMPAADRRVNSHTRSTSTLTPPAPGDPDVHQRRRRLPLRRVPPRGPGPEFSSKEWALSMAPDARVLPESSSQPGAGCSTWSSSKSGALTPTTGLLVLPQSDSATWAGSAGRAGYSGFRATEASAIRRSAPRMRGRAVPRFCRAVRGWLRRFRGRFSALRRSRRAPDH